MGDAAAFLAEDLAVVGEGVLEGDLVAWVAAGVVDLFSPYDQGAEHLDGTERAAVGSGETRAPWTELAAGNGRSLKAA